MLHQFLGVCAIHSQRPPSTTHRSVDAQYCEAIRAVVTSSGMLILGREKDDEESDNPSVPSPRIFIPGFPSGRDDR